MRFILGSGIIGYLAKTLFPDWQWIPFKRSRYFSFDVPYADNFMTFDKEVDEFMCKVSAKNNTKIFMKRPFSYNGQLMYQENSLTRDPYLLHLYGETAPRLADTTLKTTFAIYPMTVKQLHDYYYQQLRNQIDESINRYGEVQAFDLEKRTIRTSTGTFEFEQIISTIPLNAFCQLSGRQTKLKALPVNYYLIESKKVDIEGADQVLVCDNNIEFFKVQKVDGLYQFWCAEILEKPYDYFGSVLGFDFDLKEARRITDVIPTGEQPDLSELEKVGVFCVGSNAQWDDLMGVTSCLKRLLKLRGK